MGESSTKNNGIRKYSAILALLVIAILVLSGCESHEDSLQDEELDNDAGVEATVTPTTLVQPQTPAQQPQKVPTATSSQAGNTQQQPQKQAANLQKVTNQQTSQQQTAQLTQSTLPQNPANTEFIDIIDREFLPLNLELRANTTVVWRHKDDFRPLIQHIIRVRTKGVGDELTRSERLSKGQNLTFKFTEPGTYEYMDVLFIKDMDIGKIVVK